MPTLGELVVSLTAETGPFNAAMNTVSGKIGQLSATVAKVGAAVSAVGVPFALMAKSAIDNADAFGKMSQKAGTSVEFLSSMAHAANLSDISNEDLTKSLVKLSAKLQDAASGSKETAAVFQSIGVAATNSKGGLENVDKILPQIADRFAKMEDGAEKTALAVDLFGKSGADLIPLLNAGSKGLAEMRAESDRLGVTVSTSTAQAAEKFNDALTRVGASIKGVFNTIISSPIVEKLADIMVQAAEMTAAFAKAHPNLLAVVGAIGAIAAIVGPVIIGLAGLSASISILLGPAVGLSAALGAVVAALTGPVGIAIAIGAAGAALAYFALQNEKVQDIVTIAWFTIRVGIEHAAGWIEQLATFMVDLFKKIGNAAIAYLVPIAKVAIPGLSLAIGPLVTALEAGGKAFDDLNIHGFATMIRMQDAAIAANSASSSMDEAFKKLQATQMAAAAAARKLQEEQKAVVDEFQRALRPADELNKKLEILVKLGFSAADIIAVYGDQINAATTSQQEHLKAITGVISGLDALFLRMKSFDAVSKGDKGMAASSDQALAGILDSAQKQIGAFYGKARQSFLDIDFLSSASLQAFDNDLKGQEKLILATIGRISTDLPKAQFGKAFTDSTQRIQAAMGAAIVQSKELSKSIGELGDLGFDSAQIMDLLGKDLEAAGKNARVFGLDVDESVQALLNQIDATKKSQEEARRWEQTWSHVMANIVTDFSRGIADVILRARSFTSALADIGKTAGRAFIEAFTAQLFSPLTQLLSGWGKALADKLSGSLLPKLSSIGLGAVLPKAAGAAGIGAAGAGVGVGAGAGAGGGLGASIAAFASNPITIGVAGAVGAVLLAKHFIGRGRRAADDFGGEVESPFAGRLGELLSQFQSEKAAGVLTRDEALSTRSQLAALVSTYNAQASAFSALGDSQAKVVEQARLGKVENFGENFSRVFDDINATIKGLTNPLTGSGLAGTGRTLSASDHFSDAVDRFVPAVEKLATAGGGSVVNNYTINSDLNVTVEDSADPQATIDRWLRNFKDNVNGLRVQVATGINDTLKGVVVST